MNGSRLVGRVPKSYTVNIDASKVAYHTSENDVKIYMETSNGIQKSGKTYSQVRRDSPRVRVLLHLLIARQFMLSVGILSFIFSRPSASVNIVSNGPHTPNKFFLLQHGHCASLSISCKSCNPV